MRLTLILFCSFLICGFSYSQDQNKKTCTDKELTQFENFLAGNRAKFQQRLLDFYSETDVCANIVYVELVKLVDDISNDVTKKSNMCMTAVGFCKDDKTVDKENELLAKLVIADCLKGTKFVVSRKECSDYFTD